MHKRILILGGSNFQIPLIRLAKERGLHVITCDYLPSNPGHAMADEHHDVSTTDKDGVLALARRIGVDAVATLSSEPALQTVSYVANTLGLPGAPLDAIIKLTEKDKFRALMAETGLRVPASIALSAAEAGDAAALEARLVAGGKGHVVKPVDSCGSKGITVLDAGSAGLAPALRLALDHSLAKRCIVEEYIEGEQIHGDGFLRDGQLVSRRSLARSKRSPAPAAMSMARSTSRHGSRRPARFSSSKWRRAMAATTSRSSSSNSPGSISSARCSTGRWESGRSWNRISRGAASARTMFFMPTATHGSPACR